MQIKLIDVLFYFKKGLLKGMMRIFICLFCTMVFSLTPSHTNSQNAKIVIEADQVVTVKAIFDIIKAQTNYNFIYHENLFKDYPKVVLRKGTVKVAKLLKKSIPNEAITIEFINKNTILIKKKQPHQYLTPHTQQLKVSGTVKDQLGNPQPGVSIQIKGTKKGVYTNIDGNYKLIVPGPASVLVFSSLGFQTQEITVGNHLPGRQTGLPAGQAGTTINISLEEDISQLDEIVLKGYYKTTKKFDTGSVSSIKAETIEKQPVSNPLAAMQGYLPGVNITQNTGISGGGFKIEIRGRNSIRKGSEPLYIVDGVPYASGPVENNDTQARIIGGVLPGGNISPLNLINPSNIKSIEVLKDADATAIYGSRGANGVVLITTKKGKTGKMQVKANFTTGVSHVPHFVDFLNTEQYLNMRYEALANDGLLPVSLENQSQFPDLFNWDPNRYTDWQEVILGGTAYRNTGGLSFSGGNAQTQFIFSGAYEDATTIYIGDSKYNKGSIYTNISHKSVDNRFRLNVSMNYAADRNQLPGKSFSTSVFLLAPNAPNLYDAHGDLSWEGWTTSLPNPLAILETRFESSNRTFQMNTSLSYRLLDDLELKTSFGYTDYNNEGYLTFPNTVFHPSSGLTSENMSSLSAYRASRQSWIVEPQINWQKDWGKASINALIGATFQQDRSNSEIISGVGFSSNSQILNMKAAKDITILSDEESEYKYNAVFGRLNLKWADTYIVNLTGRRDGSSRFGPGRQFGNFYAIGGAWLFSNESFLKESNLLSFGKLRSSYGTTGSDNVDNYQFYETYKTSETNYNGSGLATSALFNPEYGWEVNKKFEVALELGFLQDKIFLTTAWYNNRSSNQLVDTPLPATTGFPGVNGNFDAIVENTGLEIDFRSVNLQNTHFKWTTNFNISVPRNKLVKYDGLENSTDAHRYTVGQPLSIQKLYHVTGVDPDTGLYQFEDYNNDGAITPLDRQWVESRAPKFYGGFGNTIIYKNWTLDVLFQFKKHKISNFLATTTPGAKYNVPAAILNESHWQQIGDVATIQRYSSGFNGSANKAFENYQESNAIYTDGSFIRLRNVNLSYSLPKEYISGLDLTIYLHGQNLLTFTKFKGPDPEHFSNSFVPALQQFTLGVQLGF